MANFDELNRQTREQNSRCMTPPSLSTPTATGTKRPYNEHWQNVYNNETFKANNGQYSPKYK